MCSKRKYSYFKFVLRKISRCPRIYDYRPKLANIEREKIGQQANRSKQNRTHGNITWHHYTSDGMGGPPDIRTKIYFQPVLSSWTFTALCWCFFGFFLFIFGAAVVVLPNYVLWPKSVYNFGLEMGDGVF